MAGKAIRNFRIDGLVGVPIRAHMESIGVGSIDELFRRFSAMQSQKAEFHRLVESLCTIPEADLRSVIAHLMVACSQVSQDDGLWTADAYLHGVLRLSGLEAPESDSTGQWILMVLLKGIGEGDFTGCLDAVQEAIDDYAGSDESPLTGYPTFGRWLVGGVCAYLAQLIESSEQAERVISAFLEGSSTYQGLVAVEPRWWVGHLWADAAGHDFDVYVERTCTHR